MKNKILLIAGLSLWMSHSAQAQLKTQGLDYTHDKLALQGYLAYDDKFTGKRPGVLVIHEWMGLTSYEKKRAEQLAELGYVAFVLDMYGKGVLAKNQEEASKMSGLYKNDRPLMRARALAGLHVLQKQKNVDIQKIAAIGYWTRVGGVALVARAVRRAAREGVREVTVVTTDPARAEQALAERPAAGVRVAIAAEAPAGARVVPALASYEDEARLYASLRKSVTLDGAVAYYVMRPLARLGTRALVETRVTPNQVTLAALVLGLAGAVAATRGIWILAGALAWLAATVDCIDGELARLRIEGSRRGEWLDSLADDASTFALLAGMSIGLGIPAWGAFGAGMGIATTGKLYWDLNRLHLPIDTAQYPWFFGKPSERRPPERGLARAVYLASFLFQRDAYITVVAVALALGAPRAAFFILFGGIAFLTVLLLVHVAVTHASRR